MVYPTEILSLHQKGRGGGFGERIVAEEILAQLPAEVRQSIRLPRSDAYCAVLSQVPQS